MPAYSMRPALGVDETGDRAQQGRLADTVAPDERVHAAVRDAHVHIEQHLDRPVAEVEPRRRAGRRRRRRLDEAAVLDHRPACSGAVAAGGSGSGSPSGSPPSSSSASARTISRSRAPRGCTARMARSRSMPDTPISGQHDQERRPQAVRVGEHADEDRRDRSADALQHDVERRAAAAQPCVQHIGACRVHRCLWRDQAHRGEREHDEHERRVADEERQQRTAGATSRRATPPTSTRPARKPRKVR